MTDHPITPPPKLVGEWSTEAGKLNLRTPSNLVHVANRAAQWGADLQLEADAEWLDEYSLDAPHLTITPTGKGLVEAMRPKPPSLKEQALKTLEEAPGPDHPMAMTVLNAEQQALIRRALEALPDG